MKNDSIRVATDDDVHGIWSLRRELELWVAQRGVEQWPVDSLPREVIAEQVQAGLWHVITDQGGVVRAAVRFQWEDPDFWPERPEDSVFVHGLMVDRGAAGVGLGAQLLTWAAQRGADAGARWLRLDCAATNHKLKSYYAAQGFEEVGLRQFDDERYDVALWRRPISPETVQPPIPGTKSVSPGGA